MILVNVQARSLAFNGLNFNMQTSDDIGEFVMKKVQEDEARGVKGDTASYLRFMTWSSWLPLLMYT